MSTDDLEARLIRSITENALLSPGEAVVVAVSGGPDSVALLHLLDALNRRHEWSLRLHVGHLNHQLRGEDSEADAAFVRTLAASLSLPCTVESMDVAQQAADEGVSIERAGRQCRFTFLERLCLQQNIRTVALGHHADDAAETVLQRIARGTGVRGLAGIPWQRALGPGSDCRLIRPMLAFRRAEIEAYLQENGIAFRHDATNESLAYTRNRIRHELLPLLREKFNPNVDEALIRLAEQARALNDYLVATCDRMLESLVVEHTDRRLVLHNPSLARKPVVIQTQLIRQAILRMGLGEAELTYGHLQAVVALAATQEGAKELHLPAGLRVSRRYARLVFERAAEAPSGDLLAEEHEPAATAQTQVTMPGTTPLPRFGLELEVEVLDADPTVIEARLRAASRRGQRALEEWVDADRVHPPLIARSRRPGDRFFPLGMDGMKKLSDYFIDEKVDAEQRDRAVVLCDQLGPIWIVPFRIDERVRLTRATKRVARLTARPLRIQG